MNAFFKAALILLIIGFITSVIGSWWTIVSPIGGGVNFAAGAIHWLGMTVGVIGIAMAIVGLVSSRHK